MKKWRKILAVLFCFLFLQGFLVQTPLEVQAAGTVKTGLTKEKGKYYFYNSKGVKVKNVWKNITASNGVTYRYYFGKNGAAYQGSKTSPLLKKIGNYYFAFNSVGRAVMNSFKLIKGNYYYFGPKGIAYQGGNGKLTLKKIGNNYYAFNSKAKVVTNAWKKINGSYYYFEAKGAAVKGKKGSQGEIIPALKKISGKTYAFGTSGKRLTGTYVIKNQFYTFRSEDGVYNAAVSKKLRAASVQGKPVTALKSLLLPYAGKVKKEEVSGSSCYGDGKDVFLYYPNFIVCVFRPDRGQDIVVGLAAR